MAAHRKVLIITYYWPPSGGAGVQRWLKFVKYLPQELIMPFVLTVDPQYASYPVLDNSLAQDVPPGTQVFRTKSREPYSWYRKVNQTSDIPMGGFANDGHPGLLKKVSRFIRGNFFIPDPRKGWNKFAIEKAVQIIESEKIHTVITTSPPHSTQLIGLELKKKYPHIKWIADLRDPWTDIYYYHSLFPTRWARALDARYEREVLNTASAIIVVSNELKKSFLSKSIIPYERINVLPNGFDSEDFPSTTPPLPGEPVITFVGTITDDYPVSGFLDALLILRQKKMILKARFVGKQSASIRQEAFNKGLSEQVVFLDYVEHSKAVEFMRSSTVLLLAIPDVSNNKAIITGKIFEYLATRRPILCLGPVDGDAAKILSECQAGVTCEYYDPQSMVSFLTPLLSDTKERRKKPWKPGSVDQYSRSALTKKLATLVAK